MTEPDGRVCLERIIDDLPEGFDVLRAEALAEGRHMVERLASDWLSVTTRFDRPGEALMGARLEGVLAGIGGLTHEPVLTGAMRMRRFYIGAAVRRRGIGRTLALALLDEAGHTARRVTVNAGAGSTPFWEAIGLSPDVRDGHTHVLYLAGRPHQHR